MRRSRTRLPSAWNDERLRRLIGQRGRRLLLLLDYDGTLAPITAFPSNARIPAVAKQTLARLAAEPGVVVAFVSGRSVADLRRIVGLRALYYSGNHGLETLGPGLRFVHAIARRNRARLHAIARIVQRELRAIEGAWVEDKGLSFSVHWRRVPVIQRPAFHATARKALKPFVEAGTVSILKGAAAYEVRPPVRWGKAHAVRLLLSHFPRRPRPTPVFIGDDHFDEGPFALANRLRGASILVGRRRITNAGSRLRDPADVHAWLAEVARRLASREPARASRGARGA